MKHLVNYTSNFVELILSSSFNFIVETVGLFMDLFATMIITTGDVDGGGRNRGGVELRKTLRKQRATQRLIETLLIALCVTTVVCRPLTKTHTSSLYDGVSASLCDRVEHGMRHVPNGLFKTCYDMFLDLETQAERREWMRTYSRYEAHIGRPIPTLGTFLQQTRIVQFGKF